MPNWCNTQYVIVSDDKNELNKLYKTMKDLQELPEPLVPNGFGKTWLGCLVTKLGAKVDGDDGIYCRGYWSELKWDEKGNLRFQTETAWRRMRDIDQLLRENYNVDIYFIEEECGNEVFVTNDASGTYFPNKYVIDIEDEEMDYYTEKEALKRLTEFFGKPVTSWNDGEKLAEKQNDRADKEGTDNHIWLHVVSLER